jgi:hypothetical protein
MIAHEGEQVVNTGYTLLIGSLRGGNILSYATGSHVVHHAEQQILDKIMKRCVKDPIC